LGGLQPSGPQNASGGPLRASGGRNSTAGNGGEAARLSRYRAPPKTKRGGPGKPDSPFSRRGEGQPPKTSGGHFEAIGCALVHPGRYTSTGYQGGVITLQPAKLSPPGTTRPRPPAPPGTPDNQPAGNLRNRGRHPGQSLDRPSPGRVRGRLLQSQTSDLQNKNRGMLPPPAATGGSMAPRKRGACRLAPTARL